MPTRRWRRAARSVLNQPAAAADGVVVVDISRSEFPGSRGAFVPEGIGRAAEYVRMSTEHQKYSTENQADAILQYAARRGLTIVRTYADQGKSGLRLDGRDALKQLIADVQNGAADFTTILVYELCCCASVH